MKKVILGVVILFIIIATVCFAFKFTINSKIEAKIDELNKNGFVVKNEQSSKNFKTKGIGQIEIIYPDKVASYLFNQIEDEELKKSLEKQYSLLDRSTKEKLFDGVTFDYDFTINNLTSKLNLNVYLSKLSTKTAYKLAQTYSYYSSTQDKNWLDTLLKDKKLHLNIDENGNYKLANIDLVIPNQGFFTIRGLNGKKNMINIPLVKMSDIYEDSYTKGNLIIDNINIDYDFNKNKKSSKLTIENLEFLDYKDSVKMKNLVIDSNSLKDELNISTKSKISFDEFILEKIDAYLLKNSEVANLKRTSFDITFDKIPFKEYEQLMDSLSADKKDFLKEYVNFLKALSKNGISISSSGEALDYTISNNKYFNTLKYNLSLSLNKNIPSIENMKSLKDIFEVAKFTVDMDKEFATNSAKKLSKESAELAFVDTQDANIKRFEGELKSDGIYLNNIKVFDEKELEFPVNDFSSFDANTNLNTSVTHSYELINENLLRVKFEYLPNMEVISSGGLAVSFPQLKDASKIKAHKTDSFEKIDYYVAGTEIYSGMLGKNVTAQYLMIEGWDKNWNDPSIKKEFSLDIDISELKDNYLEINLRGGALNEVDSTKKSSEIAPDENQSYTKDQQSYPVNIADIDLYNIKK